MGFNFDVTQFFSQLKTVNYCSVRNLETNYRRLEMDSSSKLWDGDNVQGNPLVE